MAHENKQNLNAEAQRTQRSQSCFECGFGRYSFCFLCVALRPLFLCVETFGLPTRRADSLRTLNRNAEAQRSQSFVDCGFGRYSSLFTASLCVLCVSALRHLFCLRNAPIL
jgi:hypothetical protein